MNNKISQGVLLMLMLIFLKVSAVAQITDLNFVGSNTNLTFNTCVDNEVSASIVADQPYGVADEVILTLNLFDGCALGLSPTVSNGIVTSIDRSDPLNPFLIINGFDGSTNQLEITYQIILGCEGLTAADIESIAQTVTLGAVSDINTVNVTQKLGGVLELQSITNQHFASAMTGTTFQRTFVIRNTSNSPFNGVILIDDIIQNLYQGASSPIPAINVHSIDIQNLTGGSFTLVATDMADLTASYNGTDWVMDDPSSSAEFQINGLPGFGAFEVVETVELVNCPFYDGISTDFSLSLANFSWGCDNQNTCDIEFNQTTNIALSASFDPNDKPGNTSRLIGDHHTQCLSGTNIRVFEWENTGQSNGSGFNLVFWKFQRTYGNYNPNISPYGGPEQNLSFVDFDWDNYDVSTEQNFQLFKNGILVDLASANVSVTVNEDNSMDVPHPDSPYKIQVQHDENAPPGTVYQLRYNEEYVCIDPDTWTHYGEKVGVGIMRSLARFEHPCSPSDWVASDDAANIRVDNWHRLQQLWTNMVATMGDGQIEHMDINSTARLDIGTLNGNTSYLNYNKETFRVLVELQFGPGLALVEDADDLLESVFFKTRTSPTNLGTSCPNIPTDIILPESIEIQHGANGRGSGDRIIACFNFADLCYWIAVNNPATNQQGSFDKTSGFFNAFFADFNVEFDTEALCAQMDPNNARVPINQRFFLKFLDSACSNTGPAESVCSTACAIPLSEASTTVNLTCPGCFIPGWNLEDMSITRTTIGEPDIDNNSFPDSSGTVGNGTPDLNRVMLGDEFNVDLTGFISDGGASNCTGLANLTINNIPWDFEHGLFTLQGLGDFVDRIAYTGGTMEYTKGNITRTINIPATAVNSVLSSPGVMPHIYIDLSAQTIIDNSDFTTFIYEPGDNMSMNLGFRVTQNLDNGISPSSWFSIYELTSFYHISGDPFLNQENSTDAWPFNKLDFAQELNGCWYIDGAGNFLTADTSIQVTPAGLNINDPQLQNWYSWCVAGVCRFYGIGVDYKESLYWYDHSFHEFEDNFGDSVRTRSKCYRLGQLQTVCGVGVSGQVHSTNMPAYAINPFPNELRNTWMMEEVRFDIPDGYDVHSLRMAYNSEWLNNGTNRITYNDLVPWIVDPAHYIVDNNSTPRQVIYRPLDQMLSLPTAHAQPPTIDEQRYFYGETKMLLAYVVIEPTDCGLYDDLLNNQYVSSDFGVATEWSNFPLYEGSGGPFVFQSNNLSETTSQTDLTAASDIDGSLNWLAPFSTTFVNPSVQPDVVADASTANLAWKFNVDISDHYHQISEQTFVYFDLPAGFTLTNVIWNSTSLGLGVQSPSFSSPQLDSDQPQIIQLGKIGWDNYEYQGMTGELHIEGYYTCSDYPSSDSIPKDLEIVGHIGNACLEYPIYENLAVCNKIVDFPIALPSSYGSMLSEALSSPTTTDLCTVQDHAIQITANFGRIIDVNVTASLPSNLSYVVNSAWLDVKIPNANNNYIAQSYQLSSFGVDPIMNGNIIEFDLAAIPDFQNTFIQFSDDAVLRYQLETSCTSVQPPDRINYVVNGSNICGFEQTISYDVDEAPINAITHDQLSITAVSEVIMDCGQLIALEIEVQNGPVATVNSNTIEIALPNGYEVAGNYGTVSLALPALGGNANYTVSLTAANLTPTGTFQAFNLSVMSDLQVICSGVNCFGLEPLDTQTHIVEWELPSLSLTTTNTSCAGQNDGVITATGALGQPTYTYSLNNGTPQSSQEFNGLSEEAHYEVVLTDQIGCTASSGTEVLNGVIALDYTWTKGGQKTGVRATRCNGGDDGRLWFTLIDAGFDYNYSLEHPDGTVVGPEIYPGGTVQFLDLVTGVYTLTITTSGCSEIFTFEVTEPDPIEFVCNATNPTCNGYNDGTIAIAATPNYGGYNYSLDGGVTSQQSSTFTNLGAGTYTVSLVVYTGCEAECTTTLVEPAPITALSESIMHACSATLTGEYHLSVEGGTSPYRYSIDNGVTWQNDGDFIDLSIGSYTVQVRDSNGCFFSTTFDLVTSQLSVTLTSTDVTCSGNSDGLISVQTNDGVAPYSYALNGEIPQTGSSFSGLATGSYTIEVIDGAGCSGTLSVDVTEPAILSVSYSVVEPSCFADIDGLIEVTVNGGTPEYVSTLTSTDNTIAGGTTIDGGTFDLINVPGGSYTLITEDVNGCTDQQDILVAEPVEVILDATTNGPICHLGTSGVITLNVTNGIGDLQYTMTSSGMNEVVQISNVFDELVQNNYAFSVADENGCLGETEVSIVEMPPIEITATNIMSPTCFNGNNGEATMQVSGGQVPYILNIVGGASGSINLEYGLLSFANLAAGTYTIEVIDGAGCSGTLSVDVTEPAEITLTATSSSTICPGANNGEIMLETTNAAVPLTYSLNGFSQQDNVFENLSVGTYDVMVTDANGCDATAQSTIIEATSPSLISNGTSPTCYQGADATVFLMVNNGTPSYLYQVSSGQTIIDNGMLQNDGDNIVINGLQAGTYTINISDDLGCVTSGSVILDDAAELNAVITVSDPLCYGIDEGQINVLMQNGTAPYSYALNDQLGQSSEVFDNLTPGNYAVVVTDNNGCTTEELAVITQYSEVNAVLVVTDSKCASASDGVIEVSGTGGSPIYEANLFEMGVNVDSDLITGASYTFAGLGAGAYEVILTDVNGCTGSATTTISNDNEYNGSIITTDFSCGSNGLEYGSAQATQLIQLEQPVSVNWDDPLMQTGPIAENLVAGTYTATIMDGLGCEYSASGIIVDHVTGNEASWPKYLETVGWSRSAEIVIEDIEIDNANSVYICGHYSDDTDFNSELLGFLNWPNRREAFVAKFSPCGLEWITNVGNGKHKAAFGLAIDETSIDRKVYVTGADGSKGREFSNSYELKEYGLGTGIAYVAKLDAENGNQEWLEHAAYGRGFGPSAGRDLVVSNNGDIFFIGDFKRRFLWDGGSFVQNNMITSSAANGNLNSLQSCAIRMDNTGQDIWVKSIGISDPLDDRFLGIKAIDKDGDDNLYFVGSTVGAFSFDPMNGSIFTASKGMRDGYVCKMDENGTGLWSQTIGYTNQDDAFDISVNKLTADVYVSGSCWNRLDFNTGYKLASPQNKEAYILKLNANGSGQWANTLISVSTVNSNGIPSGTSFGTGTDVSPSGDVLLTGTFKSRASITATNGNNIINAPSSNLSTFITQFDASGNINWSLVPGANGNSRIVSSRIELDNNEVGYFGGNVEGQNLDFANGSGSQISSWNSGNAYLARVNESGISFRLSSPVSSGRTDQMQQDANDNVAIKIYPNPSSGEVNIEVPEHTGNVTVILKDLSGKTIETVLLNEYVRLAKMDIQVASGTYFITLKNANWLITKRLIVQ